MWPGCTASSGLSNQLIVTPADQCADITRKIRDALHRSCLLDDENVTVRADGGHIHLIGTVGSAYERRIAWATAWAAPGATGVTNDLAISLTHERAENQWQL